MKYFKTHSEFLNEAKLSTIHKAAKKGSYPVSIVVIKDGKVIAQELVKTPAEVPAAFNVIQSYHKHKGATVHVESKTGERLFSESAVNEFGPMAGSGNRNYGSNDLVDRIGELDDILMYNRKAEREWEKISQNYLDDGFDAPYWSDLSDQELQAAINDAESLMKKYRIKESVVTEAKFRVGDKVSILSRSSKKPFDSGEVTRIQKDGMIVVNGLKTFSSEIAIDADSLVKENAETVNEAEIKSEKEFEDYAMDVLKKSHPDDFDESIAKKVIDGLKDKYKDDFGAMVGALTSGFGG